MMFGCIGSFFFTRWKVVWLLNFFWEHDFLQLKKLRLIITQRWTMYGRFCRVNFPSLRHVWFIYFSLFSSVVTVKRSTRTSIWTSTLPKLFGYLGQLLQQLHSEVPLSWQLFNSFHRLSLISKRNIPSGPTEGVISFRGFEWLSSVCVRVCGYHGSVQGGRPGCARRALATGFELAAVRRVGERMPPQMQLLWLSCGLPRSGI